MSNSAVDFKRPSETIGKLDSDVAARLTAAAGDVALVVDAGGIIRDCAVSDPTLVDRGVGDWIDMPWADTVTSDTRAKVEEMVRDTPTGGVGRWRLVNHPLRDPTSDEATVAMRYMTVDVGAGRMLAIGRDLRSVAAMQQRLLQAQQSMERDYMRLRQAESRYRLLFDLSSEAVIIVDAATGRIVEANPASRRLLDRTDGTIAGEVFINIIDPSSRAAAESVLASAAGSAAALPAAVRLVADGASCMMSASLFRQDAATYTLVRLLAETSKDAVTVDARQMLIDVLERLPDAFVITDESLDILAENAAFLELTQSARREHVRGQSLTRFLGRPGIDLNLIVSHLKEQGAIRNFATVFRSQFDTQDEVEVSAVAVPDGEQPCYGFTIRAVGRRLRDAPAPGRELPRSVEQLTELVGRVSLKEIVRESTDLIERLCIEAALAYTEDNRASAAEVLGLSRQSLYSKLHRHGLGNLASDA